MFYFKLSKKIIWINFLGLFFFICDRFFKYLSFNNKIFYQPNNGISFSIKLPDNFTFLFIFFIISILFILFWFLYKNLIIKNTQQIFAFEFLILGTISNLIDRIKFGFIIDYLNFYFFYNNLSDIMISIGIIFIILNLFDKKNKI